MSEDNKESFYTIDEVINLIEDKTGQSYDKRKLKDIARQRKLTPYFYFSGYIGENVPDKLVATTEAFKGYFTFDDLVEYIDSTQSIITLPKHHIMFNLRLYKTIHSQHNYFIEGAQCLALFDHQPFNIDTFSDFQLKTIPTKEIRFSSLEVLSYIASLNVHNNDLDDKESVIKALKAEIESLNVQLESLTSQPDKPLHTRSANNAGKIISALASELLNIDITQPFAKDTNGKIKSAIERQGNTLSKDIIAEWLKIAHEQSK